MFVFRFHLRNVEDLLHERGDRYLPRECEDSGSIGSGRYSPAKIRTKRASYMRQYTQWQWHLDEVFVKINGIQHYLWRAVDHEGEVLESYVAKTRDKPAALRFLKKAMKRYGSPRTVVTDRLRSYGAAMNEIGNQDRQGVGRHLNNRAENSHLPFRRRERAMSRFRRMSNLQKFASTHASFHNHFNLDRYINRRARFKFMRNAALSEWRQLLAR